VLLLLLCFYCVCLYGAYAIKKIRYEDEKEKEKEKEKEMRDG